MSLFFNYMALEKPMECAQLVQSYGVVPSNNPDVLARQLHDIAKSDDYAFNKLAEMHPDREMILETSNSWSNASGCGSGYSNCGGCGGFQAANGLSIKSDVEKLVNGNSASQKNNDMMILGVVVIVSLALIFKNN